MRPVAPPSPGHDTVGPDRCPTAPAGVFELGDPRYLNGFSSRLRAFAGADFSRRPVMILRTRPAAARGKPFTSHGDYELMILPAIVLGLVVAAFVAGVLVGGRNAKKIEADVASAKSAASTVAAAAETVKKAV